MASRFWVGGTASWDATAGTKWATTSGGAGGAAVPTSADDVFFDAASGAVTVTKTGTEFCASCNFTGFTGTFAGTGTLNLYGSLTAVAGMTWTHSGTVFFGGSVASTLTSGGKVLGAVTINGGAAQSVTLQDAMTSSGAITVTVGTFTTNNYAVTALSLSSSNSNTRTINLGSSTVTLSATTSTIVLSQITGLTFNAGTSTLVLSGAGSTIILGLGTTTVTPRTFYNLSYTSTSVSIHQFVFPGVPVSQTAIFNNVTVAAPATAGVTQVTFSYPVTINGTLSTTGTAGNRRVRFRGTTYGLAQTLTLNGSTSLTDADFRDIYVIGTAAPISGTRIGDLRGCRGITFDAPKTVYWNLAGTNNWNATAWATTPTGVPSNDNFPLAQDTATFTNAGAITQVNAFNFTGDYVGTVDMSGRTSAMTIQISNAGTVYGDWKNGSGTTVTNAVAITFSGRNTQTITSAGKTFPQPITVDSYGGTVQLADALNIVSQALTITNGTFSTQNYNVTAGGLSSSNNNVRAINLGSSTVTLGGTQPLTFSVVNLTFDCGTSSVVCSSASSVSFTGAFQTFYDVLFTGAGGSRQISSGSTYRNLSFTAPSSAGLTEVSFAANQTITGTLTVAGASPVRRIFLRSDTLGTQRDLTVGTLVATDCDFRDIEILGTAAGSSPARAGDCGGNSGITFPSPKTVYWNLAGSQNWSATGWASSSGGTPDINNFPLAQDTAVFDDAGAAGTVTFDAAWNSGSFDSSARTSAMTISAGGNAPYVFGNWSFGVGVTSANTVGTVRFAGVGSKTITSSGVSFGCNVSFLCAATGVRQLADALTLNAARQMYVYSGVFDAVTYNVTVGKFELNALSPGYSPTVKMGTGLWTLSGTGNVWTYTSGAFYKGTANIVLSDTSTNARTFGGGTLSYNKLTIGGATGISTLTITGNNQFTELASTKTVAHTIALGTTTQTFGAWTVTGTAGNVVTVTGTATITIAGARVSGVDYLSMGTTTVSATSPGEFYAGNNSSGGTNVIWIAAPSIKTRYWVGGTGTWDATTTTKWSATSGGAGGASVPTSADAVVFDSASNATAYTVTCTATQLRCGSLTMAGPASGNVTWAGTAPLAIHDNVSLAATGITRTYTGGITLSGSTTGKTFTTNGVTLASTVTVNGVGCGWTLGSALNISGASLFVTNGSFDTASFAVTAGLIDSNNSNTRALTLGASTLTLSTPAPILFTTSINFAFSAGTSQINCTGLGGTTQFGGQTYYNVSYTNTGTSNGVYIAGMDTFNDLAFAGATLATARDVQFFADQTINGTLTFSAGTNATMRRFVHTGTIGTTRTLTCAAFSATDVDFRDITIAGAAAPVSGTRLGDCKGNSGITFPAAKTVSYTSSTGTNWGGATWYDADSGTSNVNNFPLAQDTADFAFNPAWPPSGSTVTINAAYNIGTIDMSARTSNTMTLATGTTTPAIYGNWINGTGTALTGTNQITFAGRGSQTITSAGKTFTQQFTFDSPGGSVSLNDAFSCAAITLNRGTFDAVTYNVTSANNISASNTNARTIAIGSGTWAFQGTGTVWSASTATNLTVTGTGTISLTSASAKTFAGGDISYSGITLDQGGAGQLTITGNNVFKDITNTYGATGETTISLGATTQTVSQFTAAGTAGKLLNLGISQTNVGTLILTSGSVTTPDYLRVQGIKAYSLNTTWYAGDNSINSGSLGWYFEAGGGGPISVYIIESATGADATSNIATLNISVSEVTTASDAQAAGFICLGTLAESATAADVAEAFRAFLASVSEASTAADLLSASLALNASISELTTGADSAAVSSRVSFPAVAELAAMADSASGGLLFLSNITEAATAQEIAAAVLIFSRAVSEVASASEVLAAVAAFNAAVPESVVGSDVARALLTTGGSITEALTALDAAAAATTMRPAVTETVTSADSATNVYTANPTISEITQVNDAAAVAASTFGAASVETASPLDAVQGANTGTSALSESATASDTDSAKFTAATSVAEATTAQETQAARFVAGTQVAETARPLDTPSVAPSVFSAVALAAAQAAESFNPAGSVYNAALPIQGAGITDSFIGAYLWNPIDDDQNPDWGAITNSQTPTWAAVSDNQTPNWQNVNNTQGSGWTPIDTDDDPAWEPTINP